MRFQLLHIIILLNFSLTTLHNITHTSNPYFENVRIGRISIPPPTLSYPQDRQVVATYSRPFNQSQSIMCHTALNSFNIPSDQMYENPLQFQYVLYCQKSFLELNSNSSLRNYILVNYIVINQQAFGNNLVVSLLFVPTSYSQQKFMKGTSKLKISKSSGQLKHLTFLRTFSLYDFVNVKPEGSLYHSGYQISIANITLLSFDYQVRSLGNRIYHGDISFLVIIYNNQFFNTPKSIHFFAEATHYSNFKNKSIKNPVSVQPQNGGVFVGVSQFEMKGEVVFKLQLDMRGEISLASSGKYNRVRLNYLIFPHYIENTAQSHKTAQNTPSVAEQSSNNITIIIILVVVICVFIVILIIWCCCYSRCKCLSKQGQTQSNQNQIQPTQIKKTTKSQIRQSQLLFYQLREQVCTICIKNRTQMMTPCQHYFHLKCLKLALKNKHQCPVCHQLLMNRKITVFCRNCSLGYVFDIKQSMILDDQLGVDPICLKCKLKTSGKGMSEKSQEAWLQYAIQANQNLMAQY